MPNQKGYMLCDSSYVTFWRRESYGDNKKIRGAQRVFRMVKILNNIIMIDRSLYICPPVECTAPKINSKVNYRFWVTSFLVKKKVLFW